MVIEVREEQLRNVLASIFVTPSGMLIEVREEQPLKALLPMLVTLLGMVSEVSPEQPEKAEGAILTIPSSTAILVLAGMVPLYLYNTLPTYITPSGWLLHQGVPEKALYPMFVTLLGMVISVREEQ